MLFPLKTKYELCIPIKKDNSNECVLLACSFFFPLPYHSILTRKESSTGKRQWEIKNKKKERRKKVWRSDRVVRLRASTEINLRQRRMVFLEPAPQCHRETRKLLHHASRKLSSDYAATMTSATAAPPV